MPLSWTGLRADVNVNTFDQKMSDPSNDSRRRYCPLCSAVTTAPLCPQDGMATLLREAPPSRPDEVAAGTIIGGRYQIDKPIGRGGCGTVFLAKHVGTGQQVAIKALDTIATEDNIHLRRFFQEAKVTAGLKHPNTVRVFDFGQDDSGLIYLVMELVTGSTLRKELIARYERNAPFTQAEACHIGAEVALSLEEAHSHGLVHRDLKPDNIMLQPLSTTQTLIKVLDFGIAKVIDASLTRGQGMSPGTPFYMSPEQCLTQKITASSDIYSLGIILYELMTGAPPFRGEQPLQVLYQHVHSKPADLGEHAQSAVDAWFLRVIEKATSKSPDERYSSAREFREALLGDTISLRSLPRIELQSASAHNEMDSSSSESTYDRSGLRSAIDMYCDSTKIGGSSGAASRPLSADTAVSISENPMSEMAISSHRSASYVSKTRIALLGLLMMAAGGLLIYQTRAPTTDRPANSSFTPLDIPNQVPTKSRSGGDDPQQDLKTDVVATSTGNIRPTANPQADRNLVDTEKVAPATKSAAKKRSHKSKTRQQRDAAQKAKSDRKERIKRKKAGVESEEEEKDGEDEDEKKKSALDIRL
jgi:serine/threonine protein kinase